MDRSRGYLNRSQTHECGNWPRNSFSGNICFQFSVLVLCSVGVKDTGHKSVDVFLEKAVTELQFPEKEYLNGIFVAVHLRPCDACILHVHAL
jgi:hypothetical protein